MSPHVAMWIGPSLRLPVGREPAGVWPLRIPAVEVIPDHHRRADVDRSELEGQPFLLIVRSGWVVTASQGGEYHRMLGDSSI